MSSPTRQHLVSFLMYGMMALISPLKAQELQPFSKLTGLWVEPNDDFQSIIVPKLHNNVYVNLDYDENFINIQESYLKAILLEVFKELELKYNLKIKFNNKNNNYEDGSIISYKLAFYKQWNYSDDLVTEIESDLTINKNVYYSNFEKVHICSTSYKVSRETGFANVSSLRLGYISNDFDINKFKEVFSECFKESFWITLYQYYPNQNIKDNYMKFLYGIPDTKCIGIYPLVPTKNIKEKIISIYDNKNKLESNIMVLSMVFNDDLLEFCDFK